MNHLSDFYGPNAGYVLELYERYQRDPSSVDPATRTFFAEWTPPELPLFQDGATPHRTDGAAMPSIPMPDMDKVTSTVNLAQAIREYGHLMGQFDPLGSPSPGDPALDPAYHGITEMDLRQLPASIVGGPIAEQTRTAWEAIQGLRQVYSARTGYDYDHHPHAGRTRVAARRRRIRPFSPTARPHQPRGAAGTVDPGGRLSSNSCSAPSPARRAFRSRGWICMVPMLDAASIGEAPNVGIFKILLGMAHRGRLNVLAHVLQKPYAQMLLEFKDPTSSHFYAQLSTNSAIPGDVKYHSGADRSLQKWTAESIWS